jgi:RHS repeat-associated protein
VNKYLFNGKEFQDELNLNWYDYGARMYMPELGRFGTMDPMADKIASWSPFSYTLNNPINFFDPDGLYPKSFLVYDPNWGLYGGIVLRSPQHIFFL